jgi:hypothetical protein
MFLGKQAFCLEVLMVNKNFTLFFFITVILLFSLSNQSFSIPSFARQTNLPCSACQSFIRKVTILQILRTANNGVIAQISYLPWLNTQFSVQYVAYTKF